MARPYFLLGTVPLYSLGVALAVHAGVTFHPIPAALGLGLVWSVQLLTHYYNEFHDLETDRETPQGGLTGGSQVLVDGLVPPETARLLGRLAVAAVILITGGTLLVTEQGWVLVAIVLVATAAGWGYSTPPVRLVAMGVGEVTNAVVAGLLVPVTGFLLQAGTVSGIRLRVLLPVVLLAFGLALATALPDAEADAATGKLTLAARLGAGHAGRIAAGSILLGAGLLVRPVGEHLSVLDGVVLGLPVGIALVGLPFGMAFGDGDTRCADLFAILATLAFGALLFLLVGSLLLEPGIHF
ncbi:MAG: prenyltransferase [Halodesulfurarchaeum sp.]